ncbi:glycosyltransferase family 2 protein [Mucilaginibacter sp. BJC16-A38]|uniref:glycosyltransferase family 2 protein n=1 Tax=Mucilaginibacter phenanthrenivorans TaxID=1234842 RepID=UPI00215759B7|nr:glycosyltransferase family 2 protein [Mucilaginibacter phenanthrenivorans]MCR8560180.1 glycosyltransferase family 2 protein [Mucilaginibacter phenanthrenivorans]
MISISVIIATYNPDKNRLNRTLDGLRKQNLPVSNWELIIIDNNSTNDMLSTADLSWNPAAKVLAESRQGLTHARLKGFLEARGQVIVMVDDDNILEVNYLDQVLRIFREKEGIGAIGGKSVPSFDSPPPLWLKEFYGNLALRDLGEEIVINKMNGEYPAAAPIGAGMALRAEAILPYIKGLQSKKGLIADRQGYSLASGGDNDLVLSILNAGWEIGYFPSLVLHHIIPAQRMQPAYLARLVNNTNKSWIAVLQKHKINPWKGIAPWTVGLRKIKAWITGRAWAGPVNYIKWRGACGTFDGLADIYHEDSNT